MPAVPKAPASTASAVPCLFCAKNQRRQENSDYCADCWAKKQGGAKLKPIIKAEGTTTQTAVVTPAVPVRNPRNSIDLAVLEQDDLTEADIAAIRVQSVQRNNPMLTMPDGSRRVACTQCHQRPLKVARLCQECYDERMRIADWKAKLDIVRRGKGKPKLTCPWCGRTGRGYLDGDFNDACCDSMIVALMQVRHEEGNYQHAATRFEIPGAL